MTELEITIDQEVGKDTEAARLKFLKYVAYGRRLERESIAATQPIYTQADLDQALEARAQETAKAILDEVDQLLTSCGVEAARVEREFEKQPLAELKKKGEEGPIKAEMVQAFEQIIRSVDEKHTEILQNVRTPGMVAIRAKFVKD